MPNTARLNIPEIEENQNGAEIKVTDAIRRLESMLSVEVLDRDLTAPPGGESDGDVYIVGASATGAWAGQEGKLALYYDGWIFTTPKGGMTAFVKDEKIWLGYSSVESEWHPLQEIWDGTEYWTGRYNGSEKVYAKALTSITAPTASATVNTIHGITGLDLGKRIHFKVCWYDSGGAMVAFPAPSASVDHQVDGTNFIMANKIAFDFSAWRVDVLLEYCK